MEEEGPRAGREGKEDEEDNEDDDEESAAVTGRPGVRLRDDESDDRDSTAAALAADCGRVVVAGAIDGEDTGLRCCGCCSCFRE